METGQMASSKARVLVGKWGQVNDLFYEGDGDGMNVLDVGTVCLLSELTWVCFKRI